MDHPMNGYANGETFRFEVETANTFELYVPILAFAAECLRRVPGMTNQTLGVNIKLTVRGWVDMAQRGEPIRNIGWLEGPVSIRPQTLLALAEHVGDMARISEEDIGESWRESAEGVE
jgi:hypothetical protein